MKIKPIYITIGGVSVLLIAYYFIQKRFFFGQFLPTWVNYFGSGNRLGTEYTRGVRNNNPGNIRRTSGLWKGEVPLFSNTDNSFKQFYNYSYGVRAVIILLRSYVNKGYNTINKIINRYAPPSENATSSYIKNVSNYTGISPDTLVSFEDKNKTRKFIEAIIRSENGKVYLTDSQFNEAWKLA